MIFVEPRRLMPFKLVADRFEHDIKLAGDAELSEHRRIVRLTRTEVVEHGGISIQQRLDVEELPGPASFFQDVLAAGEASWM